MAELETVRAIRAWAAPRATGHRASVRVLQVSIADVHADGEYEVYWTLRQK